MRRAVAIELLGLEPFVELHAVEEPRVHLRRIATALLTTHEKNRRGVLVHLGLDSSSKSEIGASHSRRQIE